MTRLRTTVRFERSWRFFGVSVLTLLAVLPAGCEPADRAKGPKGGGSAGTATGSGGTVARAEIEEWRAEREAGLREPDSWLSLVGLEWLEPGRNLVGSGSAADIQLPETAPSMVGWIDWRDGELSFEPDPRAEVTRGGEPLEGPIALATDAATAPTELALGSLRFYVIDRDGELAVRIKDGQSPLFEAFDGIESYPIDLSWRIEARFERSESQVGIPDILGRTTVQRSPGRVVFEHDGEQHDLVALDGGEDGSLFLVFGDETNGDETYGGGRFLYTEPPRQGSVVVDFNRAYNPPCVFTPYATCPLPPPENRLPFPVIAGEKMWGAPHGG